MALAVQLFLNLTPELLEEIIDANLILHILPGPTLVELGIPQSFLSQYGHTRNTNDSSMERYIWNGMYKQQQDSLALISSKSLWFQNDWLVTLRCLQDTGETHLYGE